MTDDRRPAGAPSPVCRAYRVEGRVQMVGFRAFVRRHALDLGLSGWVRNEPDGAVTAEAAGDAESIRQLEEHLRQGPPAARVDRLSVRDLPDSPLPTGGFEVRF